MHGPLQEIGVTEVLQLLERGKRTGRLTVEPGDGRGVIVAIAEGRIVAVEPDASDDGVRETLRRRHLLAEGDNVIEVDDQLRRDLALRAFGDMVHWQHGRFDFRATASERGPLDLATDEVMFSLVEREGHRFDVSETTEQFRSVPVLATHSVKGEHTAPPVMDARAWRVLDLVDGVRSIDDIANQLGEPVEEVGDAVLRLIDAAILDLQPIAQLRAVTDDGVSELEQRVLVAPDDAAAWRALGLAQIGAGQFDRALATWQEWQRHDPAGAASVSELMHAARTMMEALREPRD